MKPKKRILIVDDDQDILIAGKLLLKRQVDEIVTCHNPELIPQHLNSQSFDAVLLDMNFSPGESNGQAGIKWLKKVRQLDPDAVIIMITAHADTDIAVKAMKHGASDFICKPWNNEKVIATLTAAIELHHARSEANRLKRSNQELVEASGTTRQTLLGNCSAMNTVHSMIQRAAPTDANILILCENGTGKELVAREIHKQSLRADAIFMSVDLGAVSESLFESELFGHCKGAYTGATKDRIGRLAAANGGTLFLDEIGNIPLHLQAKLLTVLEQRKVTPLGSNKSIILDIRVIAATNSSMQTLSDETHFRQDLLFRLNTVEILLPPLRQRKEDIEILATHYASLYAHKYRKPEKVLSASALAAARAYDWPGNVRALRHTLERAVILSEGEELEVSDLQLQPVNNVTTTPHQTTVDEHSQEDLNSIQKDLNLERMEKRLVKTALQQHRYNISKAAKELGLTRAALYRRMEKYDL